MSETYKCPRGHQWEDTWGDDLSLASGQVTCPICGDRVQIRTPGLSKTNPITTPPSAPASPSSAATVAGEVKPLRLEKIEIPGYEILGELGRGGMGVVYKARQTGLKRIVALKMVLAGSHASESGIARFKAEAEAVARFQHANIVQIYEISEHEGRPFFSMEFVDGGSLHGKMAGNPQPVRESAQMLALVSHGMHAAHQAGIVHRDLKPANILLARDGTPKITDFGLAKQLDEASQLSQTGDVMGTPSYMAPEQAAGRVKQIGPPADVYALGAVLYEMLTGRPPFKSETAMDTMLQVLYADPVPPSFLRAKLPRDVETICMKCLQKDPAQRYGTALALAEDLQRFLDDKPIVARPVSALVRTWKWVKRHPAVTGALAITALAGTAMLAMFAYHNITLTDKNREISTLNAGLEDALVKVKEQKKVAEEQRKIADQQRDIAVEKEKEARTNFRKAREAVNQMLSEVGATDLENVPLLTEVRRRLLERARTFHEGLTTSQSADPDVRQETGRSFRQVGEIYKLLELFAEASKAYDSAIQVFRQLAQDVAGRLDYAADLAQCHFLRGQLYMKLGQLRAAREDLSTARDLQSRLSDAQPKDADARWHLSRTLNELGLVEFGLNHLPEALQAYNDALKLQNLLVQEAPANLRYREDRAGTHNDLGKLYRALKRTDNAVKEYTQAVDQFHELATAHKNTVTYRQKLAAAYSNRGNVQPLPNAAEKDFDEALKIGRRLMLDFPEVPIYRLYLANTLNNRASALPRKDAAALKDAADGYGAARQLLEELTTKFADVPDYQAQLGGVYDNLADVLSLQGDAAQARTLLDEAYQRIEEARKKKPQELTYRRFLRNHYETLAHVLLRGGKGAVGDHAAAARAAAKLPELLPDEADEHRQAARLLGRCIVTARTDPNLKKKEERDAVVQSYGKQALTYLQTLVAKRQITAQELVEHEWFRSIRETEPAEFKKLVDDAPKKLEASK